MSIEPPSVLEERHHAIPTSPQDASPEADDAEAPPADASTPPDTGNDDSSAGDDATPPEEGDNTRTPDEEGEEEGDNTYQSPEPSEEGTPPESHDDAAAPTHLVQDPDHADDLAAEVTHEADRRLIVVYGDTVHRNDGRHLHGGVNGDEKMCKLYDQVISYAHPLYELLLRGPVGKAFLNLFVAELTW